MIPFVTDLEVIDPFLLKIE